VTDGRRDVLIVALRLRTLCARRMRTRTDIRETAVEMVFVTSRVRARDCSGGTGRGAFSSVFLIASGFVAV